jgi:hypothetical protein
MDVRMSGALRAIPGNEIMTAFVVLCFKLKMKRRIANQSFEKKAFPE